MKFLKKLIPFRLKYIFLLYIHRLQKPDSFVTAPEDGMQRAYIFLAADYGNLGDVAITYAQTEFLRNNLGESYEIVEIPISKSIEGLWSVKRNIREGDLVTTVGGGNMGDMYEQIEYIRQLVVRFFPSNPIFSFPQTIDFANNHSEAALQKAKQVYNSHKNLTIVAREKTSFVLMKKYFPKANVILTPDIVLTLDKREPEFPRKGLLICMRQDAEKALSAEQNDFIIKTARKHFAGLVFYDTHIGMQNLSVKQREIELQKIWTAFKSAELVITDRLHGMIFCHITGTPALVFQNNNHKVRETFDWIKMGTSVSMHPEFSEETIDRFFAGKKYATVLDPIDLSRHYNALIELLK